MRSLDEADSEKTPKELVGEAFQLLSTDASAAARRAIELLESDIEFQPKRIATLSWIAGSGLTISGEPREAMGYLDRAEATFQEYHEKSMVLWVMRYKAAAHSELYEFEKGKAAAQRGLKLARETGPAHSFGHVCSMNSATITLERVSFQKQLRHTPRASNWLALETDS